MTRIKQLQALMIKNQVEQVLVFESSSIYYLTGIKIRQTLMLHALLVPSFGQAQLIYYTIQRYELKFSQVKEVDFLPYSRYIKPLDFLASLLAKRVNLDKDFPLGYLEKLRQQLDFTFQVDDLVDQLREVKDEQEQQDLRIASKYSDETISYAKSLLVPGISEIELHNKVVEYIKSIPACDISFTPMIMFDNNISNHHCNTNLVFTNHSVAMFDLGVKYKEYHGDVTRMFFHRCNSQEYGYYQIVLAANLAAIKTIKAGRTFADVDNASRAVLAKYKMLDLNLFFVGHSVGLKIHELDYVSSLNNKKLKAGMVFSIEPGCYFSNKIGVRVEDLIIVTDQGCEVLNHFSKEDVFLD